MIHDWFSQSGFRCRLAWGWRGAEAAAEHGDILVVVDVLRFSSLVATAVQQGGEIQPCYPDEDRAAIAARIGGMAAAYRTSEPGRYSLSPLAYIGLPPQTRVVVASPNGATCSRYAASVPCLIVGCLLNARAVAAHVNRLLASSSLDVTVLACGERWRTPSADGELRFAIEDYLGAGAILAGLAFPRSPEAEIAARAFQQSESDIAILLRDCGSGQELIAKGCLADVTHCARRNLYDAVPVMVDGRFVKAQTEMNHPLR